MMIKKVILYFLLAFTAVFYAGRLSAQSACSCWQTRDATWSVAPFTIGTPPDYRNDDGYTNSIPLPFSYCFWGVNETSVYIDNNGNLAFGSPFFVYTSNPFPVSGYPLVAPFWSDVDTRNVASGLVYYKVTPTYMVVQWDSVGYYDMHTDKLNTFQVIISNGTDPIIPYGANTEFCYKTMQWTTGDASGGSGGFGGSPATVGLNKGDGIHYIQFGKFDQAGNSFIGQYPPFPYDGVGWLSNKSIIFNGCNLNAPPAVSGVSPCDTFKICIGDTVNLHIEFFSPKVTDSTWANLFPPLLSGVTIIGNTPGNTDSLTLQIVGTPGNVGYHVVNLYGYDNEIPPDTTVTSFVLEVDSIGGTLTASQDTICLGDSVKLKVVSNATQFLWSTGQTTDSVEEHPIVTTTYTVQLIQGGCSIPLAQQIVVLTGGNLTVTKDSICIGDSTTISVHNAVSFVWSNGATTSSITVKPTGDSTYKVYALTACGNDTLSKKVHVFPLPNIAITGPDSICKGNSATFTASGGIKYLWSTGATTSSITVFPTTTTTYSLTVSSVLCSKDTSFILVVNPKVFVNIAVQPADSICLGDSTNLVASGNALTYLWLNTGQTSDSIWVKPGYTTTYSVVCNNLCGIPDTGKVKITINPLPVLSFSADTAKGCTPVCTLFNNTSSIASGSVISWLWNFGDGSTDTVQTPYHCFVTPGTYNVSLKAVSNYGCVTSLSVPNMIDVYNYPIAAFTLQPQPVTTLNPTIYFTNNSSGAGDIIGSWLWNFGDGLGLTDTTENPSYTYQDTGTFCPTLRVTTIHGCADSVTECLVISPLFTLYIPSAFSPNADGKNDVFIPKGGYLSNYNMYIFDRWGNMLFHTTDLNTGWNGRKGNVGAMCEEDTYIYMITCTDNFNKEHSYIGRVTLVK